jgi:hypothetical protein
MTTSAPDPPQTPTVHLESLRQTLFWHGDALDLAADGEPPPAGEPSAGDGTTGYW